MRLSGAHGKSKFRRWRFVVFAVIGLLFRICIALTDAEAQVAQETTDLCAAEAIELLVSCPSVELASGRWRTQSAICAGPLRSPGSGRQSERR